MLNKVILMGRLVKDPELKYTPSSVPVVSFTLAVERKFQKQDEKQADFINAVAWRTTAEIISRWFKKGQMIALCGSLQTRAWEDNEGKRHYVTEVTADEVSFCGGRKEAEGTEQRQEEAGSFTDITLDEGELPF